VAGGQRESAGAGDVNVWHILNFKQMVNYGWSALAENLKVSRHYWEPV
jgi:hypothetical protein